MTAIHNLIETALYSKLSGDANLTALVGTRFFDTFAPDAATIPYVLYQQTAGGDTNDTPRRNVDTVYRMELWSTSQAEARTGAGLLDDALRNQELTISGWSNWRLMPEGLFSFVETVSGKQFFRKGFFIRISADKNAIP